jgi:hypothetical protein
MHTPSACSETNPLCGCRTDWRARRVCGSSPPKWCRRLAISRAESAIGTGPLLNWGRDRQLFREFYAAYDRATGSAAGYPVVCTGPITYQGQTAVQRDIDTFKAALAGVPVEEAFIPAVAPGTIELQRRNAFYPTDEAYLFTIAEAMREEYRAIVDAGFLLQIDDPRMVTHMACLTQPLAWQTTGPLPSGGLKLSTMRW